MADPALKEPLGDGEGAELLWPSCGFGLPEGPLPPAIPGFPPLVAAGAAELDVELEGATAAALLFL